jgi:hypothetical protein
MNEFQEIKDSYEKIINDLENKNKLLIIQNTGFEKQIEITAEFLIEVGFENSAISLLQYKNKIKKYKLS